MYDLSSVTISLAFHAVDKTNTKPNANLRKSSAKTEISFFFFFNVRSVVVRSIVMYWEKAANEFSKWKKFPHLILSLNVLNAATGLTRKRGKPKENASISTILSFPLKNKQPPNMHNAQRAYIASTFSIPFLKMRAEES